ncbi:MAG: hypothetical protein ACH0QD_00040 [Tepidibacillus sp.]
MQTGRRLAAVYVLDLHPARRQAWIHFAHERGLGVFDVYSDAYVGGVCDFRMFDQLIHDAKRGCFDTVILHYSTSMMDIPGWSARFRRLFELDVRRHLVVIG